MIKISREVNCPSISCRAPIRLLYFECIFDFCLSPARCTVRLSIFCCKSCSRLLRDYFHSNGWFLLWNAWTISLGWKALKSHYFVWDFNLCLDVKASRIQLRFQSHHLENFHRRPTCCLRRQVILNRLRSWYPLQSAWKSEYQEFCRWRKSFPEMFQEFDFSAKPNRLKV